MTWSSLVPPIFFYIPPALWPAEDLPTYADQNWAGYGLGIYAWTVQTYLKLRSAGLTCELTYQLPAEGIVFCHSNALRAAALSTTAAAAPRRLLVCMKAESPLSAIAPVHIVQNPIEASPSANCYYIPHWPQPQLIARDRARGDRFESLAFFGHEDNLTAELKSSAWQSALGDRHLSWQVIANTNRWNQYNNGLSTSWNNYANIDAIVAVRSFDPRHRWLTGMFSGGFKSKPATKLYNAWLAGAIPILGVESAYRETGQRGQDYMEVKSFKGLLNCLDRLKSDVDWRRSLLEQGQQRAQGFTADKIVRKWQVFIEAVAIPTYAEWCDYSPRQRQQALIFSRLANYRDRLARRGQRIFNV